MRTRRHLSSQERRGWCQQWRRKEWKRAQLHHTGRVPMRGQQGGRESEVGQERRALSRNRCDHWQASKGDMVANELRLRTGEGGCGTFGAGL